MTRLFAVTALFLLAAGCVPKGKYTDALSEGETLRTDLEATRAKLSDRESTIARLEKELAASEAALEETNRKLAQQIAEAGELQDDMGQMRTALADAEMRKARADAALAEYRDLVARFQALIDSGTLSVKIIDGQMVVELATDILFPPGSSTLSAEGEHAIEEVAQVLAALPDREYQVAGHTDSMPIATARFPTNWHLGAARAISVVQVLQASGLTGERVSAASYAEFRPVATNRTVEGRGENRRIEILVVPDLSSLPGYEELEALTEGEASP